MHAPTRSASVRIVSVILLAAPLIAISGARSVLHAQERRNSAELWGRVFLAGDTIGLAGTPIEVSGVSAGATTSRTGFYRFAGLTPGLHVVRVRRLGYQSVTMEVDLQDDRAVQRDIHLQQLPNLLTEVRIEGQVRKVPPRYQDVYRRMTTANGTFITREDIEQLNPRDLQSLLMRVPTLRVDAQGIKFARCNEAGSLMLSRGGGKVHIYIDGLRMTGRLGGADPGAEHMDVLRLVNPSQIQAIEVYSGASRIPGEFLEDACELRQDQWTTS